MSSLGLSQNKTIMTKEEAYFRVGKWTNDTQCKQTEQRTSDDAKYTDGCLNKDV